MSQPPFQYPPGGDHPLEPGTLLMMLGTVPVGGGGLKFRTGTDGNLEFWNSDKEAWTRFAVAGETVDQVDLDPVEEES